MGKNIKRFNQFTTDRPPTENWCLIGAPDIQLYNSRDKIDQ